jgi:hypothetical protein
MYHSLMILTNMFFMSQLIISCCNWQVMYIDHGLELGWYLVILRVLAYTLYVF